MYAQQRREGVRKSTTQKREHCLLEWGVVTDDVETPQRHAKVQRIFSSVQYYIFKNTVVVATIENPFPLCCQPPFWPRSLFSETKVLLHKLYSLPTYFFRRIFWTPVWFVIAKLW